MPKLINDRSKLGVRRELRKRMTHGEDVLWRALRSCKVDGYKIRRQVSIGPYIADFYCPIARLVIEVDGASHFERFADQYDRERDTMMREQGFRVLRFTDREVCESLSVVVTRIRDVIEECLQIPFGSSSMRRGIERSSPPL